MMKKILLALIPLILTSPSLYASDTEFTVTSENFSNNSFLKKDFEFQGFGCDGGNLSPQLSWKNAPKETKAYAIMAYDPDAPSGSGWWHWQAVNIPTDITSIAYGKGQDLDNSSAVIKNDYGSLGYGGVCPPKGHGIHHYQFTVYALSEKLVLPANPSSALVGYMVKSHSLASSTIIGLYQR